MQGITGGCARTRCNRTTRACRTPQITHNNGTGATGSTITKPVVALNFTCTATAATRVRRTARPVCG